MDSTTTATTSNLVVISVGNRKVLRSLTFPLPTNHHDEDKNMVVMCCTGIKSDVDWVIRHMQKYVATVWETYDHHPIESSALAYWLSRLLGSFQDNDLEEEWQSSIRRSQPKESSSSSSSQRQDTTLESSLVRPLGVQAMLLSTSTKTNEPNLLRVETTGRVFRAETTKSFEFVTIGKESEVLKERLLRSSLENGKSTPADLEQLLIREILETLGSSRGEALELIVETIRPEGIECTLLTCKNGKILSRLQLASSALH
jgi:20S proteasome alpha/beta subunit